VFDDGAVALHREWDAAAFSESSASIVTARGRTLVPQVRIDLAAVGTFA